MKIWIDGYEANVQQRLGSSQVAIGLLRSLEKIDNKNEYTILLPSLPLDDLPEERQGWRYRILKPKKLWTKIALPLALYSTKQKPDLFFSPTHYLPGFSPVRLISTIFDLSFLHFPQMFEKGDLWKLKTGTKYSIESSDQIITISNFSKQDIVKQYGVDKSKITVAYPGYDNENFKLQNNEEAISDIKSKYQTGDTYIIYIGTIQPRKNLIRLIEAVKKIENLNFLVIGKTTGEGKEGWMYEETLKAPKDLGIEERVKFLGFVKDEDLPLLLSGSKAFVLPSLWEGFGIAVVEAMACGIPVIVSNISSLPEVVGKAGLLVDPYSTDQIEQAIRAILTDKKLRKKYSKLALKQAEKFSWEKMARVVLKVFKNIG